MNYQIDYTAASCRGSRRSNQDNLCVGAELPWIDPAEDFSARGTLETRKTQIFCVCDGVGGENFGDVASLLCLEQVMQVSAQHPQMPLKELLQEAAERANSSVKAFFRKLGQRGGCTMTILAARNDSFAFLNLGDSPAFLLRRGEGTEPVLTELSYRHNLKWEKLRNGEMPGPRDSGYLLRYIGDPVRPAAAQAYITEGVLCSGDALLLCSDGVTNQMDNRILQLALESGTDARILVNRAAEAPNSDNATAICLQIRPMIP